MDELYFRPFVPPNVPETPSDDLILKTKHQLDFTLASMDERVAAMLELTETELPVSFYSLVHVDDALCLAEAHKEGSSTLLVKTFQLQ